MATTVTIYRLCVDGDMENCERELNWLEILLNATFARNAVL